VHGGGWDNASLTWGHAVWMVENYEGSKVMFVQR